MPTVASVEQWIIANILDSSAWDSAEETKKSVAVTQAQRNLQRWYPGAELTEELVAYQTLWELQGSDPAIKFQKQGVKSIGDKGESITYGYRDKVAPEVREILGTPQDKDGALYGGELI